MNRQDFEQQFISISDQIWEFAEPRYQEFHSSTLQAAALPPPFLQALAPVTRSSDF